MDIRRTYPSNIFMYRKYFCTAKTHNDNKKNNNEKDNNGQKNDHSKNNCKQAAAKWKVWIL